MVALLAGLSVLLVVVAVVVVATTGSDTPAAPDAEAPAPSQSPSAGAVRRAVVPNPVVYSDQVGDVMLSQPHRGKEELREVLDIDEVRFRVRPGDDPVLVVTLHVADVPQTLPDQARLSARMYFWDRSMVKGKRSHSWSLKAALPGMPGDTRLAVTDVSSVWRNVAYRVERPGSFREVRTRCGAGEFLPAEDVIRLEVPASCADFTKADRSSVSTLYRSVPRHRSLASDDRVKVALPTAKQP